MKVLKKMSFITNTLIFMHGGARLGFSTRTQVLFIYLLYIYKVKLDSDSCKITIGTDSHYLGVF